MTSTRTLVRYGLVGILVSGALSSCANLGNVLIDSAVALGGVETEEVRIAGINHRKISKGDPLDGSYASGPQLCVVHYTGCRSWIFSSGNDGHDTFFADDLPLPPLAFLKRVDFVPYWPAGLNPSYGGNVFGSGSYGVSLKPPTDLNSPQIVEWENSCHGEYGGKPIVYAISFVILKAKQTDLGEATFPVQPIADSPCMPSGFTGTPTPTPAPTPTPSPMVSGWSGTVRICNPLLTIGLATLHLEAHCANGSTTPDCTMKVDIPNLKFDPGGGAGAVANFKTPQTFAPGPWVITLATLTTPDPLGELAGVPITRDLPGGIGNPELDFTGGRCL